ncbi:MAG: type I-G CRISPR-associated protein, Cas3-extension family [Acidimicrobiales bacterium]
MSGDLVEPQALGGAVSTIVLPALRSDDALGFLAALGVVELLSRTEQLGARLGWEGVGGAAVLQVDVADADIGAVAERFRTVAVGLRDEGRPVPCDAGLIQARVSPAERKVRKAAGIEEKNDPMRAAPVVVRDRLRAVAALELAGDEATPRWASGLVTMLGIDRDGNCILTPLYAPAGQQVLGQLFEKYARLAAEPGALLDALVAWRRVPDTGANLDYRDLRDAVVSARGDAENATVPGAIWLALMASPLFRQVGDGRHSGAVGWAPDRPGGRPRNLVWPVWTGLRSPEAVEVLLAHPDVRDAARPRAGSKEPAPDARRRGRTARHLDALGVIAVCSAGRTPLGNADGPLQAARVVWPA